MLQTGDPTPSTSCTVYAVLLLLFQYYFCSVIVLTVILVLMTATGERWAWPTLRAAGVGWYMCVYATAQGQGRADRASGGAGLRMSSTVLLHGRSRPPHLTSLGYALNYSFPSRLMVLTFAVESGNPQPIWC